MKRKAAIVWEGSLLDGKGVITAESRIFVDTQNYRARSGVREGNHAELIAAAIAVCFAMDLTRQLGQTGLAPERIAVAVAVMLEEQPAGWTITSVQLDVSAQVRGAKQGDFILAALNAKNHCPISPLLKATISMNARLIA